MLKIISYIEIYEVMVKQEKHELDCMLTRLINNKNYMLLYTNIKGNNPKIPGLTKKINNHTNKIQFSVENEKNNSIL